MKFTPRAPQQYLRIFIIAMVTALVGAVVAACGGGGGGSGSGDTNTLNVLTWETYHDPAWLDAFAKETGIKVNAVNVGSADEMFAKIKANPNQFDLALVTSGWFDNYAKAGLLEPIDASKVTTAPDPGFDWKSVASSGGKQYGVLYNWGNQPLAWLPGSIPNTPEMAKYLDSQGSAQRLEHPVGPRLCRQGIDLRRPHLGATDDPAGARHRGSLQPQRSAVHRGTEQAECATPTDQATHQWIR